MVLLESALYKKVKKKEKPPGFVLKGIDEKTYSLDEFKGKPLLVVFMCNHCPYVKHKITAITALDREFRDRGLQIVGINSNDPEAYPEDSEQEMRKFADQRDIEFPYLIDETQSVARKWGATCTPDPFLLDANLRLAYHGRIDDAQEPGTIPTTQEMKIAITQLLEGKPVEVEEKPSIGCSIKWK